jgi:hypothetical protein
MLGKARKLLGSPEEVAGGALPTGESVSCPSLWLDAPPRDRGNPDKVDGDRGRTRSNVIDTKSYMRGDPGYSVVAPDKDSPRSCSTFVRQIPCWALSTTHATVSMQKTDRELVSA